MEFVVSNIFISHVTQISKDVLLMKCLSKDDSLMKFLTELMELEEDKISGKFKFNSGEGKTKCMACSTH
jgi:hypothetical protein